MFLSIGERMVLGAPITPCWSNVPDLRWFSLTSSTRRAGVDAARSFATGCFATHRTHDLRGLTDKELQVWDPRSLPADL